MFPPISLIQRSIFPFFFLFLILILASGCGDDNPVRPQPGNDFRGVVRDKDGRPAPDATVFLGRDPGFIPEAATVVFDSALADPNGRFEFNDLAEGTYRVYAGIWESDDFSQVSAFSDPVDITAKSTDHCTSLDLRELTSTGVVVGTVSQYLGLDLIPADSTTVSLHRYLGADLVTVAETTTNSQGGHVLENVKTGNYTVTALKILDSEAPFPLYLSAESESFFSNGDDVFRVEHLVLRELMVEKPAVYIYPEQAGRFQVGLDFGPRARLTASEPEYGEGWDVFVEETGRMDGSWDYLFYEIALEGTPLIEEGWCLSWSDLSAGLRSLASVLGLNPAEQEDFLDYWLARLPRRPFYAIIPVLGSDLDSWVKLDVRPVPDAVLRFWLFFRGTDTAVVLNEPDLPTVVRTGTTVVEWGGAVTP